MKGARPKVIPFTPFSFLVFYRKFFLREAKRSVFSVVNPIFSSASSVISEPSVVNLLLKRQLIATQITNAL